MRQFVSAAVGLWFGCASSVMAQSGPVVVELYTSQGCSSCPPADAFMAELAKDPNVIALSLHVDYWDYIGWRDTFANPQYTQRQKAYAKAAGSRMIYTPQMIIGGLDRIEGNAPEEVAESLRRHLANPDRVTLSISRDGNRLVIRAIANPPLTEAARVQLVRYRPQDTLTIGRGENAGREVTYTNIVTSWQALADWPGTHPLELEAQAEGSDPVVVIVQSQGPAKVLAAAQIK